MRTKIELNVAEKELKMLIDSEMKIAEGSSTAYRKARKLKEEVE